MGKKAIRRSALVVMLSREIREGYAPGPERERWLRWLVRVAGVPRGPKRGDPCIPDGQVTDWAGIVL
jgi:hypothetical protein